MIIELKYFSREKKIKLLEICSFSATVYIAVKSFLSKPTRKVTNWHLKRRDTYERVLHSATATYFTWQ